jgi:hypothetical protein
MPRTYGTTNASPSASAPAVGVSGDMYWDTTNKVLYVSDGTAWQPTISSVIPISNLGSATTTVNMGGFNIINHGAATGGLHVLNRNAGDGRYPQLATLTAKGDVIVATASGVVARQGVGTNGQVLMADSTQTNGVAWGSREIGFASSVTNVNVVGSAVRIVGIASVAYKAGRKYKISALWRQIASTVANDVFTFFLAFGASPTIGAGAEMNIKTSPTANEGVSGNSIWLRYAPGSDITQDTYLYCVRVVGSGTGTVQCNSTAGPLEILVEDIT